MLLEMIMYRILTLALALCPLALGGCGVAKAIGDYSAADSEWNDYKSEKAVKARTGYEAGMTLHGKYMANAAKAEYNADDAVSWYDAQEQNMGNIDKLFAPVQYSEFYEKIFFTYRAMGQGWDKLAFELDAFYAAGIDDRPNKDELKLKLDHAIGYAQIYYQRLSAQYAKDHPAIAKTHADKIAAANVRLAALAALKIKNDAR